MIANDTETKYVGTSRGRGGGLKPEILQYGTKAKRFRL